MMIARSKVGFLGTVMAFVCMTFSQANALDQQAASVIGFSSQYSATTWSAQQATGEPNVMTYGDNSLAWTSSHQNGSKEYITLGFLTPVYAHGVTIRETWGNGFVYRVDVVDTQGKYYRVWSGEDTSQPGTPVDFLVTWPTTNFLVSGVKIYVDTDHNLQTWEEIDAVQLHGSLTPPSPDLSIRSIVGPAQGTVGEPVSITTSVKNKSAGNAGPFIVGLYLSTNRTINPAQDRFLGGIALPALAGLDASTFTLLLVIPESVTPGAYYLGAFADTADTVTEESETNNTRATSTPIQIAP